jgi:hypothetical protein
VVNPAGVWRKRSFLPREISDASGKPDGARLSNSPALNIALSNASLISLGLPSLAINKAG